MSRKRFVERVAAPFAGCRVDREAGVIYGVKLCGFTSENGRDYPPAVFRRDIAKYENAPINFNHGSERRVEDVGGRIKNPKVDADGTPRGDAHLLKTHPMYERVMEAAEKDPGLFGFSHVAYCTTGTKGGRETVEGLESVESVDLVAQPATTKGLFEGRTVKLTVRLLCEALVKHPKVPAKVALRLKRLGEMGDYADVPTEMDAAPPEAEDAEDAVMAAFKAAIAAVVDKAMSGEIEPKEALSKIKALLSSHAGLNDDGTPDADDDPATPEGKKRKPADLFGLLKECRAECGPDFTPSETMLKALALLPDAADRKALLAEHKAQAKAQPERPQSGRTPPAASAAPAEVPSDPKKFAEWVSR